jgi:hypothetical protein
MIRFEFVYQDHLIVLKTDFIGNEQVFVDNTKVSHSLNWKFKNEHKLNIDNQELTLKVYGISTSTNEMSAYLYEGDELIERQIQQIDLETYISDGQTFNEAEIEWKKEIEMSKSTSVLAYAVYFLMLFTSTFSIGGTFSNIGLWLLIGVFIYAIFEFFRVSLKLLTTRNANG